LQAPVRLRIGVHIEQGTTLTLVQAMLADTGHDALVDRPGEHSLAAYLGIILDQTRNTTSVPYDLLILGGAETDSLTSVALLKTLVSLLALVDLPILILSAREGLVNDVCQNLPHVAVLSSSLLSMHLFFRTLGHLTGTTTSLPTPIFESARPDREARLAALQEQERVFGERQARLREEEHRRVEVRKKWLDQRQEWLDQRNIWLDQRQEWFEAKSQEPDPQQEWLAEQQTWLISQRREVEQQQSKVSDLRRWLLRYQRRIDEEPPDLKREAQF
jgi:hypothetical protein